jgi:hypothetical protein
MDIAEFEELLDRLGEDVSRWPAPSRDAARVLLRRSTEARDLVARAQDMRRALAPPAAIRAPAGLAGRIVARAMEASPPHQVRRDEPRSPPPVPPAPSFLLRPAVVFTLCFALGVTAGLLPTERQADAARVDFATLLARMAD